MADLFDVIDEWGPEKIITVSDQKAGMRGVLVIDNTALGMGKGGTRMQPSVTVDEVRNLARVMTWKWAAVDLFYGGAKAGIQADPTASDKERILRSFVRKLSNEVPEEYVFGLDMGLTEVDAAIINDELGRGCAVGTPHELGGVAYDKLGITGFGVAEVVDEMTGRMRLTSPRVAIQGFGAVGHAVAKRLDELGYCITAISTAAGAIAKPDGLNIAELLARREEVGDALVDDYPDLRIEMGSELFTEAEIIVPAAVQHVLNEKNASQVQAKLIVEGANLPTTLPAREYFHQAGVNLVPDFIANAGGVVSAAFAMQARFSPFRVDPEAIYSAVSEKLRANANTTMDEVENTGAHPHLAAQLLAQKRVRTAMDLRGSY